MTRKGLETEKLNCQDFGSNAQIDTIRETSLRYLPGEREGINMTITVIIPIYNAEKTLETCVKSVTGQELAPSEILLIDDGSKDASVETGTRLSTQFPVIRMIKQEHGGVSAARNRGIQEASGDWLLFLDADDTLADGALSAFSSAAHEHADAVCGKILRGNEKPPKDLNAEARRIEEKEELLNTALKAPTELLTVHGWMLRRKICTDNQILFNPALRLGEDSEFMLRFLSNCRSAVILSVPVYSYHISPVSTINAPAKGKTDEYLKTLDAISKTEVAREKNWPIFVLCTLLLILTHDTFHPANQNSRRQQLAEAKKLREIPIFDRAFDQAQLSETRKSWQIVLRSLKHRIYLPAYLAVKARQRYNMRHGKGEHPKK